jgi:hypothetical protein
LWNREVCKADVATNFGDESFLLRAGLETVTCTKMAAALLIPSAHQTWLPHKDDIRRNVYRNYEICTFWLATNLAL